MTRVDRPLTRHSHGGYDYLWRPAAGASARTLLLLHGTGDDAAGFVALADLLDPEAAAIVPEGDVLEHGHRRFFRRRAEGVYDMDDLAARTAKLDGFVAGALEAHGRAAAGLVAAGFSNGANILANLLLTSAAPPPVALLLHPLIPFTPPANPALRGLRVLIVAGRRDPIAPLGRAEALAAHLRAQDAGVEIFVHEGAHGLPGEALAAARAFLAKP